MIHENMMFWSGRFPQANLVPYILSTSYLYEKCYPGSYKRFSFIFLNRKMLFLVLITVTTNNEKNYVSNYLSLLS